MADPRSLQLIRAVLSGRAPSMLDRRDRPLEYDDVGRLCSWQTAYPDRLVRRSPFERVVMHALAGDTLRIGGSDYTPTGMQGWSRVAFRRDADGARMTMPLEDLLRHLPAWNRD